MSDDEIKRISIFFKYHSKKLNNCQDQYFDNLSIITRKDENEIEEIVDGYIGKLDDELYQKIKKRIL